MKVWVLFENGSDGKEVESCIMGVTTNNDTAIEWADKDQQYRDIKECDLDSILCVECNGHWKIPPTKVMESN